MSVLGSVGEGSMVEVILLFPMHFVLRVLSRGFLFLSDLLCYLSLHLYQTAAFVTLAEGA